MSEIKLLLTDEAIAQAALDAGISGAYSYPGTPATEILEYIQEAPEAAERKVHREWSANEKTALEEALGMSFAGKRALVSMKHVGLNVAADPFINSAITGVNGGLVVVATDDPSMHSSQNEQDSRFYAAFAGVPALEPADQQEAYNLTRYAFDLSERLRLPVLLRLTTRLAHSRADVRLAAPRAPNALRPVADRAFVLLPVFARRNYEALLDKQPQIRELAAAAGHNRLVAGADRSLGIIACGITWNYLMEAFRGAACPYPVLALRQYPAPAPLIAELAALCSTVLVLEEGAPLVETQLRGLIPGPLAIRGRLDGALPRAGELSADAVARALGLPAAAVFAVPEIVVPRPPVLCQGCPYIDIFNFLNEVMRAHPEGRVFSDIGCYTLGALPPYEAICSCVDMGAAITMAKGAADAGLRPAVAVIGDSTFGHSGITGLLDAVYENSPITVLILDNDVTAMTGGQVSLVAGRLEAIVRGVGVAAEHLHVIVPAAKNRAENAALLRAEIAYPGVSVIIARRPCIHVAREGTAAP